MITTKNLNINYLNKLFNMTKSIKYNQNRHIDYMKNKILINAFFEPSTRTSLSFESAMYKLGGKVINFNKDTSSLNKGESINDTLKTLENYGDIIVIRHPDKNIIHDVYDKKLLNIPIINGGNGAGEHPSQALLDLYTIYEKYNESFDNLNNLKILFIGDILHSRTVNSLAELLQLFPSIKINILPYNDQSTASNELLENISKNHNQNINEIIVNKENIDWNNYDIFYVTRYQKERKLNHDDINDDINDDIIINNNILNRMKKDVMIMHPLPRNREINPEIDKNERVYYFKQMENGVYIRMALIYDLLSR